MFCHVLLLEYPFALQHLLRVRVDYLLLQDFIIFFILEDTCLSSLEMMLEHIFYLVSIIIQSSPSNPITWVCIFICLSSYAWLVRRLGVIISFHHQTKVIFLVKDISLVKQRFHKVIPNNLSKKPERDFLMSTLPAKYESKKSPTKHITLELTLCTLHHTLNKHSNTLTPISRIPNDPDHDFS